MAQRRLTSLVDDLDGADADETVRFGLGGVAYEIDLSSAHAAELRSALAPFVDRARRVRAVPSARQPRREPLRIGLTIDPSWPGGAA